MSYLYLQENNKSQFHSFDSLFSGVQMTCRCEKTLAKVPLNKMHLHSKDLWPFFECEMGKQTLSLGGKASTMTGFSETLSTMAPFSMDLTTPSGSDPEQNNYQSTFGY